MKSSLRSSALVIVAFGCATLIVPLLTPPDPFYPPLLGFIPYVLITAAVFLARTRPEHLGVLAVSALVAFVGGYLYLDPIYFNRLFVWDSVWLVAGYVPAFALAPTLGLVTILTFRRLRTR
jgi:hypothetical protein